MLPALLFALIMAVILTAQRTGLTQRQENTAGLVFGDLLLAADDRPVHRPGRPHVLRGE